MKTKLCTIAMASALALSYAQEELSDLVELVKDIYPGTTSSNPIGLTEFNGKAYFAATGEGTGVELYVSDGESDGTTLLMDINPGAASSNPSGFVEFDGKLYFKADDGTNGAELWVTDGTLSGTQLFFDINDGSSSSNPSDFVVLGDKMVFEATTAAAGTELWVTDGTVGGTKLLDDIQQGINGSSLQLRPQYKIGDDTVIFTANDGVNGQSLYGTDGTEGGTVLLQNLTTDGSAESSIISRPLETFNDKIFFTLASELWVTDGTTSGTRLVQEGVSVGSASRVSSYELGGRTLFFGTRTNEEVDNLWETDGTLSGTKVVFDGLENTEANRGASSTFGIGFGPVINDKISLLVDNGVGVNIWVTDGDDIEQLIDTTFTWVLSVKPSRSGDSAWFLIKNDTALELWVSDYTPSNTQKVATFPEGISTSVGESVVLDDELALFTVSTPEYGVELWKMEFPRTRTRSPTRSPTTSFDRSPTRTPTSLRPDVPDFQAPENSSSAPLVSVGLATVLVLTAGALILA